VIAGQGTVGIEIVEDVRDADCCGCRNRRRRIDLRNRVRHQKPESCGAYRWCRTEGAPTMTRALQAGKPVRLEKIETIADGLSAPYVGEWNYAR